MVCISIGEQVCGSRKRHRSQRADQAQRSMPDRWDLLGQHGLTGCLCLRLVRDNEGTASSSVAAELACGEHLLSGAQTERWGDTSSRSAPTQTAGAQMHAYLFP